MLSTIPLNNIEQENTNAGISRENVDELKLNGSWENKNRSITAAAVTGLIGIGAIYFNVQSILMIAFVFIYKIIFGIHLPSGFAERMNAIAVELKTPTLAALVISQYVFMLLPALWIVKKWHTSQIKKYVRIRLSSIKEIILAVLITVTLLPLSYYLSYLLMKIFPIPESFRDLSSQLFTPHNGTEFIVLIFVIAVTPAICEEIFFRGYVQRTLERTIGAKSFIVTGILFGLFHMQPLGLISLSLLGVLFSFFYYRSKSIFPSSAAHFTNNLIAIILLYAESKSVNTGVASDGNLPITWIIFFTLIACGLIIVYITITREEPKVLKIDTFA